MTDMENNFATLFAGNLNRRLTGTPNGVRDDGKKLLDYKTIKGEVTAQQFAAHLAGDVSLGLSPLRDGKVRFGALDIDIYPITDKEAGRALAAWKEPCLAAWTKSRGLHIYVFTDEWVPAALMRKYLATMRKRLAKKLQDGAKEIFPKQEDGDGNQINLPAFGPEREPCFCLYRGNFGQLFTQTDPPDWVKIKAECYVTRTEMERVIQTRATDRPAGYRLPTKAEGRRMFLWSAGCSMQARGWDDAEIATELRTLNTRLVDEQHALFHAGGIDDKRLADLIKEVLKLEKGTPQDLTYDVVARFNERWAMMMVNGKVEFLNQQEGVCYPLRDFNLHTAPDTIRIKDKSVPISQLWIRDIDRLQYTGIVIEPPDYDGPGYNIFKGWACEPEQGDASLWVDYIKRILCSDDEALAHWVMTYIADGVQRPWSVHPGSALALRGGQGGGKSFLGRALRRLIGKDHAQEIAQSDRMFAQFNRGLFGSTFVLAEESLFAGSRAQASTTKSFVTSEIWTYEQKYLASFSAKNVHRVIATTNEDQAVHIDHDDRRWTVIEVPTMFADHGPESRSYWEPYYRLIDDYPGIILDYLMRYEVDPGLIQYGCTTKAKADDKVASDPVVAVMHEIALTGVCPDDLRGEGKMSTAALAREAWARGANRYDTPRRFANQARNKFGATTVSNCTHIERVDVRMDSSGLLIVTPIQRTDRAGVQMPPLNTFRAIVAKITGEAYPENGEWAPFKPAGPGGQDYSSDPNGGDVEAVEQFARENGQWVEADIPF